MRVNVDGDARDELVVVSTTGEWIGLLAGGDGTLTASWIGFDWLGEWNLQGGDKFTAADLDGDGREELFVVSGDGEYAGILREQGGVLAPSWMAYDWIGAWNLRGGDQFLAADVDGDGRDELVVASLDGDYLGVLREEDGALKATWMTFDWVNLAGQSGANGWDLRSGDVLVAADVDGDGGRELVVRNVGGEWIGLLGWDDEHLNAEWIGLDWIHHPGHGGEDGWKLQPGDTAYAVSAEP